MLHYLHKHIILTTSISSFTLYIISLFLTAFDAQFNYRWVVLGLYVLSLTVVLIPIVTNHKVRNNMKRFFTNGEIACFFGIVCIASLTSLLFIQHYPYVSMGDEVRDAGLNALQVVDGTLRNFFGYGHYNGYGNIIPVLISFSYRIFGPSVLSYRLPAAFIYIVEIYIFYILLRLHIKRSYALLGTLIYTFLPLHMFFARTEVVVGFDSFWTVVLLCMFSLWLKNKILTNYILLGLLIGIASQFHTSSRIIALIILWVTLFFEFTDTGKKIISQKFISIFLLILFCLIGFGPTILYSSSKTFLQSERFFLYSPSTAHFVAFDVETFKNNYTKSLMVWFYEGMGSRYPESKPLLPAVISTFFLLGVGYCIFTAKNKFLYVLILMVFVIPLTNSALTDTLNMDHRLTVLLPIGSFLTTIGIMWLFENTILSRFKKLLTILLLAYLFTFPISFFTSRVANKNRNLYDYLTMHIIYFLQSDKLPQQNGNNEICIEVSENNYFNLSYMHSREQLQYFLPDRKISLAQSNGIADNEAYIFNGQCPLDYNQAQLKVVTSCTKEKKFSCPTDYHGEIVINY